MSRINITFTFDFVAPFEAGDLDEVSEEETAFLAAIQEIEDLDDRDARRTLILEHRLSNYIEERQREADESLGAAIGLLLPHITSPIEVEGDYHRYHPATGDPATGDNDPPGLGQLMIRATLAEPMSDEDFKNLIEQISDACHYDCEFYPVPQEAIRRLAKSPKCHGRLHRYE